MFSLTLLICASTYLLMHSSYHAYALPKQPNIVFILADDLGWNDVSFHGSDQIPTPNIDRLAKEGVILNNYYVQPICTPSRSAIMTGKYPIHTGMQTSVILGPKAWGLGLNETILPQVLKREGYRTHGVGKWHLGFFSESYLPTRRGFDSFYGYYLGKGDYWDHSDQETYWGLDLHDHEKPVMDQWGNYSTYMYTDAAIDVIKEHNASEPLFLYLAYQAVHSANNENDPIQAPLDLVKKFSHIENEGRRKFAAVVSALDTSIGKLYETIMNSGMGDNTIIIFSTDNGGPANGFDMNYASNSPLRGVKSTLWEGGVRGVGFVHSKLLKQPGYVSNELYHITDWFPTILSMAGGSSDGLKLDGINIWESLSEQGTSPREEILLNIDPVQMNDAALRVGDYKLIMAPNFKWSGWFPVPMSDHDENHYGNSSENAVVKCGPVPSNKTICDQHHGPCLFNIREDPCEYHNIAKEKQVIYQQLLHKLEIYRQSMIEPRIKHKIDPRSDPKLRGGVWGPWI